ncbi:unnamed protein product [Bathycoccus prasinos]
MQSDEVVWQVSFLLKKFLRLTPKFLIHKNKQRLTKLTQLTIRSKKIAKTERGKLVQVTSRETKREKRREAKAEVAARIEKSIEEELLVRFVKIVWF